MTVIVSSIVTPVYGVSATNMYRKRPRYQHAVRRAVIPILGLMLALVLLLWFVLEFSS
jgi:hypothetical protein